MATSTSADLVCVDPAQIRQFWPHVSHLIRSAVERCGDWTFSEIEAELIDGRHLLWITWDGQQVLAAAITRLATVPRGLICNVVACAGADGDWPERAEVIEQYAKREGCVATRLMGRAGWSRVFKDYTTEWVCLEKRLD